MAERELKINIIVEADGSITKLKSLDDAMARLSDRSLAKVSAGVSTVDKELGSLQKQLDKTAAAANRADTSTGKLASGTNALIGTLGKFLTVGAILGAINSTLKYADAIEDAAKQTGIGTREFQKLSYAAQQSNLTVERLTGLIGVMQDRLAGGDKSANAALAKMNLSWSELKKLAPDKQLYAISDGIRSMTSHEEKVAAMTDLFGRGGREALPAFAAGLREVADQGERLGAVMSDEAIVGLEKFDQAIENTKTKGKVALGELVFGFGQAGKAIANWANGAVNNITAVLGAIAELGGIKPKVPHFGGATPDVKSPNLSGLFGAGGVPTGLMGDVIIDAQGEVLGTLDGIISQLTKGSAELARGQGRLTRETDRTADAFRRVTADIKEFETAIDGRATPFGTPWEGWDPSMENPALDAIIQWNELMRRQGGGVRGGQESKFIGGIPVGLELDLDAAMNREMEGMQEAGVKAGRNVGQSFGDAFKDILVGAVPQIVADFADALMGRGPHSSVAGNVLANLAQTGAQIIGDLILPGLGQVLAPIVGELLYKPSMRANDMRDEFISQAGGLGSLNRRAVEAGTSLNWLLNADDPAELQKAIEALTRQIEDAERQRREDISKLLRTTGLVDPTMVAAIAGRQGFLGGEAERSALEQFLTGNLGRAAGGFQGFLQAGGQVTAGNAAGFGAGIAGVFGEMVGSGAATPLEALKALGPVIEGLQAQFSKLGVDGGAAFADISSLAVFLAQEGVEPAIQQVLALNEVMVGLHNVGLLTEDTFDALTGTITETFNKLVAEGKNGDQALRLMQPSLQTIWELQQDFGYSVDEATQKLLDQAAASGLVGDKFRSAEERMTLALERLIDRLDRFIDGIMGIGDAAEDAADEANKAFGEIDFPDYPRRYPDPTGGQEGESGGSGEYARGGMVRPRYLAWGGPSGTDTVPAWLTPGEFVMRRSAVDRIGVNTLSAMNEGAQAGTQVTVNISAVDGDSVKRFVASREFADAFVDVTAKNTHQVRTRSRAALGVS